mmetsp:Transcript_9544/g.34975  ORF Transcript_9544/g.34975 Transcript_9544/m.34975 type:complete len:126 (-) Transcript_9544:395-772(-)
MVQGLLSRLFSNTAKSGYEKEQAARALESKKSVLLQFTRSNCSLCSAVRKEVEAIPQAHQVAVATLDVDDIGWLPEVTYYDIQHVPTFVLLNAQGKALCKSKDPKDKGTVMRSLASMLTRVEVAV